MNAMLAIMSVASFCYGAPGLCSLLASDEPWIHSAASWVACVAAVCAAFLFLAGLVWRTSRERTAIHADIKLLTSEVHGASDNVDDLKRHVADRFREFNHSVGSKFDVLFKKADESSREMKEVAVRTTAVETTCRERARLYQIGLEALTEAKEVYEKGQPQPKPDHGTLPPVGAR